MRSRGRDVVWCSEGLGFVLPSAPGLIFFRGLKSPRGLEFLELPDRFRDSGYRRVVRLQFWKGRGPGCQGLPVFPHIGSGPKSC